MLLEIENWEPVAELLQRNNYAISSEKYLFIKFLIYFYRFGSERGEREIDPRRWNSTRHFSRFQTSEKGERENFKSD